MWMKYRDMIKIYGMEYKISILVNDIVLGPQRISGTRLLQKYSVFQTFSFRFLTSKWKGIEMKASGVFISLINIYRKETSKKQRNSLTRLSVYFLQKKRRVSIRIFFVLQPYTLLRYVSINLFILTCDERSETIL